MNKKTNTNSFELYNIFHLGLNIGCKDFKRKKILRSSQTIKTVW